MITLGGNVLAGGGTVGLEREALRVSPNGGISQSAHPSVLGAALSHPHITTDFSEALIEFITPPFANAHDSLAFLRDVQQFAYMKLDDELLWAASMPCVLSGEKSIPIATYGTSNLGLMKTVYRRGLAYRYGRTMQAIAGIHFNYSFPDEFWSIYQQIEGATQTLPDFMSDNYFALIRNLLRYGWLVPYLFGASPAVCKSFVCDKATRMEEFDSCTYYEPYATSLRMGDIGYQNKREYETGINVCYDNLDAYVASLRGAIATPCPKYAKIGVKNNGEYLQLNANMLQIENEYYSTVRPKQVLIDNEKPSTALKDRGVRYIELRSPDVNIFDPLGISEEQIRFLEILMLFCLFHDSPFVSADERRDIDRNMLATAHYGRDPALKLWRQGNELLLKDWALEIFELMQGVCESLDGSDRSRPFSQALESQKALVLDPEKTPSARILAEMRENGEGFFQFTKRMSLQHQRYFRTLPVAGERYRQFEQMAEESLARQRDIEAGDTMSFDDYLNAYLAKP